MLTDSQSSPHAYTYVEEARKLIKKIGSVGCIYMGNSVEACRSFVFAASPSSISH